MLLFSRSTKNLIANYITKLWGLLSIYIFVPFYIKLLGIEAYGIISLYTLIFSIASIADMGLSSAITREFAKSNTKAYKRNILSLFEKLFFLICVVTVALLFLGSTLIATKWLKVSSFTVADVSKYVKLIGIGVGIQLMTSVYFGSLMGLQKQVLSNMLQLSWSVLKTLGAVVLLNFIGPDLKVFFVWQILCNVVYLVTLKLTVKSCIYDEFHEPKFGFENIPKDILSYISGMVFIAILSSLNNQADKVVTSKIFTLKQFGYYSLASTIAQLPFIAASPIAVTIFPVLTALVSEKKSIDLSKTYKQYSFLVSLFMLPIITIVFLYANDLILLFSKKILPNEIDSIQFVAKTLTLGGAFLALQLMPFYLLLAHGKTKYTIVQNSIQLVFTVIAIYFCVNHYGFNGVAIPWLLVNLVSFIYLNIIISKEFFPFQAFKKTIFFSFIIPVCVNLGLGIIFNSLEHHFYFNSILLGLLSIIINILLYITFNEFQNTSVLKLGRNNFGLKVDN